MIANNDDTDGNDDDGYDYNNDDHYYFYNDEDEFMQDLLTFIAIFNSFSDYFR